MELLTKGYDGLTRTTAYASVASNASAGHLLFVAPHKGYVRKAFFAPTGANQTGTTVATNLLHLQLINVGTGGAGTTVLASWNHGLGSIASWLASEMVVGGAGSAYHVTASSLVSFELTTAGAATADGKAQAGMLTVEYVYIA